MGLNTPGAFWAMAAALMAPPAATAQTQLWFRQFGSPDSDISLAATPDGAGGVFVAGHTTGELAGPNPGAPFITDAWLARYHGDGEQAWIIQFGTEEGEQALGVAPDGSGGVYAAGGTHGSLGGPNAGDGDVWLARHDGSGNRTWILQFGTSLWDNAMAVSPDGTGGVLIGGPTAGGLGGPFLGGINDIWFARYDSAGIRTWIRQIGTGAWDSLAGIAPDGAGGAFIAGFTTGSLYAPNTTWMAIVARYDGAGNLLWGRQLGGIGNDVTRAVIPDGAGGVFAAGHIGFNSFLARYDGAGNPAWIPHMFSSTPPLQTTAVALAPDGAGGAYIGGWILGNLGGPITDKWLARCGGNGNETWFERFGPGLCQALAADGDGGAFAAGNATSSTPGFNDDAWVARYRDDCYPDCNADSQLTVADFGCFQGKFVQGAPYADCNTDAQLTVADFGCFQTKFALGCP